MIITDCCNLIPLIVAVLWLMNIIGTIPHMHGVFTILSSCHVFGVHIVIEVVMHTSLFLAFYTARLSMF